MWRASRLRNFQLNAASNTTSRHATVLLLLNLLALEGALFFSAMFLDPLQDFALRQQVMPHLTVLLLGGLFWTIWLCPSLTVSGGFVRGLAAVTLAVFLTVHLWSAVVAVQQANRFMHSNAPRWLHSPGLELIMQRYARTPIFTNSEKDVFWQLGRTDLYQLVDLNYLQDPEDIHPLAKQLDRKMLQEIKESNAVIVYFIVMNQHPQLVHWLRSNPSLRVVDETSDAIFLQPVDEIPSSTTGGKPTA
jgi:hypothetical protein